MYVLNPNVPDFCPLSAVCPPDLGDVTYWLDYSQILRFDVHAYINYQKIYLGSFGNLFKLNFTNHFYSK